MMGVPLSCPYLRAFLSQANLATHSSQARCFGGPDRDRTDDLFHAMEARSQLRHRPTGSILRDWCGLRQCLAGTMVVGVVSKEVE
jgi:hypothetical protein